MSETTFNDGQESFESTLFFNTKRLVVGKSSQADYSDVQSAVNASKSGDSIIILEGKYDIEKSLIIGTSNISIEGMGDVEIVSSYFGGSVVGLVNNMMSSWLISTFAIVVWQNDYLALVVLFYSLIQRI